MCILKKNLPCEPYVWESAMHIYTSKTIEIGLLKKKKGDILQIDECDYEITEIMPVDCFLFRIWLKKLRDIWGIKEYSLPVSADGQFDVSDFTLWLKENMQVGDKNHEWFDNYKDLHNIPI